MIYLTKNGLRWPILVMFIVNITVTGIHTVGIIRPEYVVKSYLLELFIKVLMFKSCLFWAAYVVVLLHICVAMSMSFYNYKIHM